MRWLVAILLLAASGAALAQQDALGACVGKVSAEARFAPVAARLAGTAPADDSNADKKEQPLIADWAAARGNCVQAANRNSSTLYRPPLEAIALEAEIRVLAAAEALYNHKSTWREYGRERQAIAEEQRSRNAALQQRIQYQNSALEQADRQSRERAEMQRDLENAERQAALALQQVQGLEDAARRSTSSRRGYGAAPVQPLPMVPYRGCYRFGSRNVCTYR